jgi:hypothetical protein
VRTSAVPQCWVFTTGPIPVARVCHCGAVVQKSAIVNAASTLPLRERTNDIPYVQVDLGMFGDAGAWLVSCDVTACELRARGVRKRRRNNKCAERSRISFPSFDLHLLRIEFLASSCDACGETGLGTSRTWRRVAGTCRPRATVPLLLSRNSFDAE